MLLSADFNGTTINYTSLPRWYVKPDWETERWGYKPRPVTPDPAVFPVSLDPAEWPQTDFCPLTVEWQVFWRNLMAMAKYQQIFSQLSSEQKNFIQTAFNVVTSSDRAFDNSNGTDTDHPKQESLICAGNYVYELERKRVYIRSLKRYDNMVNLYSFDCNDAPPPVTLATLSDPRVQIAKIVYNGYLGEFTMLKGVPVPFPFLTNGRHWYPEWELRKA